MTTINISLFLVLAGALFMALSLPAARSIRGELFVFSRVRGKWRTAFYLIWLLLFGYLLFDLLLYFKLPFPLELLSGILFFGGAIFVFTIISIFRIDVKARKKVEDKLRESESCFQGIFNSANEAIFIQEPESGALLGVNEKLCEMFRMTHEEAVCNGIANLIQDNTPRSMSEWKERTSAGEPWVFEWTVKDESGSLFWVEGNARVSKISGKALLLVSMRDVTGRKRLEERLARLNACFLGFTDSHDENIRLLTQLCGELMGADCALYNRLEGGTLRTAAHWHLLPDFRMSDKAEGHLCTDIIMQGGGRLYCIRNLPETSYARTDPNIALYALQTYIGMPVKCNDANVGSLCVFFRKDYAADDEDAKFLGILASAVGMEEERGAAAKALSKIHAELESRVSERTAELAAANERLRIDIAEKKKAEEALWKSESILRKLFEAIPDMVAVIDRDLRLLHCNWQGGYEYVPEDKRSGNPHCYDAFYPEKGSPCDKCHALKVFETGGPVAAEKFNPRIGLVEVRAFPIFDDAGEIVMVAEYIRNITEKVRMEEELRKAHKLESLGVLAGGIAHDFNNLLTGILGNISMAKVITDPANKVHKRLDEAEKAVWRARDLTQQLMTFSKGGSPVKKTASIKQIVMDSASFVLRGSNVRCDFKVKGDIWPVEVDEGQISQVINNLIINADQSMVDGGVIEVGIENFNADQENEYPLKEGRYVRISVKDRGVGIPEEHLHRIFDPYFTTKQKGSGLGLATVYSIIKNHDGHIRVESQQSVGTVFDVFIPASKNTIPYTLNGSAPPLSGSGRILVMDDDEIIREVASEILEHLGYEPEVCSDGKEAIRIYQEALAGNTPFSAVIMDLTIPGGMGGREAIKKLREIDNGVVGIVSSGYCNDPILADYSRFGFSGIVEKPYSMEKLGKVLHGLLCSGKENAAPPAN